MYYSGWTAGKVYSKSELDKFSKEKLNEDPNRKEADIRSIKDWMSKQPHLKENGRKGLSIILALNSSKNVIRGGTRA